MYRSPTRLYLNRDRTKIVPENSREAAFVLCGAGGELDDATVRKYGLRDQAKADAAVEPEEAETPPASEQGDESTQVVPDSIPQAGSTRHGSRR